MNSILLLGLLALLLMHLNLRDRVKRLEQERDERSGTFVSPSSSPINVRPVVPVPVPQTSTSAVVKEVEVAPVRFAPEQAAVAATPGLFSVLVSWFKEHTLIKIGGIFFFLGSAWFVSYAIRAGWLSPELRIVLGFLLALGAYGLGFVRRARSLTEYHVLTALGTGIVAATVLAAEAVFGIIPPLPALSLIALAVLYTVIVALKSRTLWLTLVGAVLGLCAPILTSTAHDAHILFPYLAVLVVGLLVVGLKTDWRWLTLTLLLGVLWHELSHVETTSAMFLFSFVVLFSFVFFVSTTLSLIRSNEPKPLDVSTLSLLGLGYIYLSSVLLFDAALAIFMATAVVAFVGYGLLSRHYSARVVALYLGLATVGVLVGTSFLFSGFSLVLAYIIEVAAVFLLVTHLGLPERIVLLAAALQIIPLLGSISSFVSPSWRSGAWHGDAFVVYLMLCSLTLSTLWLIHKPGVGIYRSSRTLAAIFGIAAATYAYAVVAVVSSALFVSDFAAVVTYLLWALISVSILYYSFKKDLPLSVAKVAASSLLVPVVASAPSFVDPIWSTGVYHSHGFGLLGIITLLLLATLLMTQQYCKEFDRDLRSFIGGGIVLTALYVAATLTTIWDNLLPYDLSIVASYVSYAIILYVLVSILVLTRAEVAWVKRALLGLLLPALLSLDSFTTTGWSAGPLSPDAIGLFAMATILMLLGFGLRHRTELGSGESPAGSFAPWIKALFIAAFLYSTGLVWSVSHSAVDPTQAVTLSLFIYTVTGLCAYLYGKHKKNTDVTYAGVALLTIVVLRLLLVEVWTMELIWRVITFLGIGALFIAASLFERRP